MTQEEHCALYKNTKKGYEHVFTKKKKQCSESMLDLSRPWRLITSYSINEYVVTTFDILLPTPTCTIPIEEERRLAGLHDVHIEHCTNGVMVEFHIMTSHMNVSYNLPHMFRIQVYETSNLQEIMFSAEQIKEALSKITNTKQYD